MGAYLGKTLLITGGTGSFGQAALQRFLNAGLREIRIFSRDELKQHDLRNFYKNKSELLKFYIGDVRDRASVDNAMNGVDFIFHAAALKQVPSCEFFPLEAVRTNVLGTANVLDSAVEHGVSRVVCLSTDKAAYPVNAMGTSKAMMEKVVIAKARTVPEGGTVICCTRYGNVMASRGSVIPLFADQVRKGLPITITEPSMTRFMMSLEEAVDLVHFAFVNARPGDLFVQKAAASTIGDLAQAIHEIFEVTGSETQIIGVRHGEKLHETLLTSEECARASDLGDYYCVPADNRDLNYDQYFTGGDTAIYGLTEYSSENTQRLTVEEVKEKLLNLPYMKNALADWRSNH
ncbi:MAG: polysaccharide biosynthesis protein [Clostridiales Family XIII bacterium]|nr:polysaccharide biosynthesis protein [Clostridiales Family XIII bacterium]